MKLYTIKEIAKKFEVSRNRVYDWIDQGLPVIKIQGNNPRIFYNDVIEFMKKHKKVK